MAQRVIRLNRARLEETAKRSMETETARTEGKQMTSLKESLEKYYSQSITNITQFSENYIQELEEHMNSRIVVDDELVRHGYDTAKGELLRFLRGQTK